MKKEVIIKILSIQDENEIDNKMEVELEGLYYKRNGKVYITYEDTSLEVGKSVPTTIRIHEKQVTVSRKGSVNTQIVYKTGYAHKLEYVTEIGILDLEVLTKTLKINEKSDWISINIIYSMATLNSYDVESRLSIEVYER